MTNDRRNEPIFVGYLPTPKRDHAFLRICLPLLLILAAVVAVAVSIGQPNPGTGVWDTGKELALDGELIPGPYPMLRVADESRPSGIRTWLLVEQGKTGVQQRVSTLGVNSPVQVTARGFRIERDGQTMLELIAGKNGLVLSNGKATSIPPQRKATVKQVSLLGEIIDSKCWLGVMKPGFGKPHKACATLCIEGGVPAMFIWNDESGKAIRALLLGSDGKQIIGRIRNYIAEPITIEGDLDRWDDLYVIRVDAKETGIRSAQRKQASDSVNAISQDQLRHAHHE